MQWDEQYADYRAAEGAICVLFPQAELLVSLIFPVIVAFYPVFRRPFGVF